jgi:hypothetical protein
MNCPRIDTAIAVIIPTNVNTDRTEEDNCLTYLFNMRKYVNEHATKIAAMKKYAADSSNCDLTRLFITNILHLIIRVYLALKQRSL